MTASSPPLIFDRRLYARRRARAARTIADHDFLHRRAMADIVDRLELIKRDFPTALFYGADNLTSMLTPECGVGVITHADMTAQRLPLASRCIAYDEESSPLAPGSFDLAVSLLTLHHANDLVGALTQMRIALKPNGLLLAVLFGEDTLKELRRALYAGESAAVGGVSSRIAPFGAVRDLGSALQRAGFALPVADVDKVEVLYRNALKLLDDIRGMGEAGVLADRGKGLTRAALDAALSHLSKEPSIRFDLVTLTGWAPHESQQKPLKPGSATHSLEATIKGC